MLHLIFQPPANLDSLERVAANDCVLFLNTAVFCALKHSQLADWLTAKSELVRCFVLQEDMVIRGIIPSELANGLEVIDYPRFVQLTVDNPLIYSWH